VFFLKFFSGGARGGQKKKRAGNHCFFFCPPPERVFWHRHGEKLGGGTGGGGKKHFSRRGITHGGREGFSLKRAEALRCCAFGIPGLGWGEQKNFFFLPRDRGENQRGENQEKQKQRQIVFLGTVFSKNFFEPMRGVKGGGGICQTPRGVSKTKGAPNVIEKKHNNIKQTGQKKKRETIIFRHPKKKDLGGANKPGKRGTRCSGNPIFFVFSGRVNGG